MRDKYVYMCICGVWHNGRHLTPCIHILLHHVSMCFVCVCLCLTSINYIIHINKLHTKLYV